MQRTKIFVKYVDDPAAAIDEAIREHGENFTFILVPAGIWEKVVPPGQRQQISPKGDQNHGNFGD